MNRTKPKTRSRSFTCLNPECGRIFADPIYVQDLSSKNSGSYHACPYCLTEIVIEKTFEVEEKKPNQKKKRTKKEKEQPETAELIPSHRQSSPEKGQCPYYFGYLSQRSRKEKIPEECMICENIVQCMLKKVTG